MKPTSIIALFAVLLLTAVVSADQGQGQGMGDAQSGCQGEGCPSDSQWNQNQGQGQGTGQGNGNGQSNPQQSYVTRIIIDFTDLSGGFGNGPHNQTAFTIKGHVEYWNQQANVWNLITEKMPIGLYGRGIGVNSGHVVNLWSGSTDQDQYGTPGKGYFTANVQITDFTYIPPYYLGIYGSQTSDLYSTDLREGQGQGAPKMQPTPTPMPSSTPRPKISPRPAARP